MTAFFSRYGWLCCLFLLAIAHRAVQWSLLQAQVATVAVQTSDMLVMQLLPTSLWRENFWAALHYLQQTPPLPNILYGLLVRVFDTPQSVAAALVLLCSLLSSIASVLLALLLHRLAFARWVAVLMALVFVTGADVLMADYFAFGQSFYEQLTMVLVLLAAHAALAVTQTSARDKRALLLLGTTVALLALTRATFSYFVVPVLLWLCWVIRAEPRRIYRIAVFLLPVLLLHGGWALKQRIVYGEWMWATSSWGGINLSTGGARRQLSRLDVGAWGRGEDQRQSMATDAQHTTCLVRWEYLWSSPPIKMFRAADEIKPPDDHSGPSPQAVLLDQRAEQARGLRLAPDTAATREFSQCLQKARLQAMWRDPLGAIQGAWQSYGMFWGQIASLAENIPTLLIPEHKIWLDKRRLPFFRPQGDLLPLPSYSIRQHAYRVFFGYQPQDLAPARVLVMPMVPGVISWLAMWLLHLAPLVAVVAWRGNDRVPSLRGAAFAFMALTYLYVALLSSVVEYGENMRFRLEVEPLTWVIGLVVLRAAVQIIQRRVARATVTPRAE